MVTWALLFPQKANSHSSNITFGFNVLEDGIMSGPRKYGAAIRSAAFRPRQPSAATTRNVVGVSFRQGVDCTQPRRRRSTTIYHPRQNDRRGQSSSGSGTLQNPADVH